MNSQINFLIFKALSLRLTLIVFVLLPLIGSAQTDSTATVSGVDTVSTDELKMHSPGKASLFSAVLPGLGQAYNKKYWKIPIVYGLIGGTAFYAVKKSQSYVVLRDAYIAKANNDLANLPVEYFTTSESNLRELQETARDNRDRAFLFVLTAYLLNIIDANVDAYLFHFDVSDDLSFQIHPYTDPSAQINYGLRLTLKL